VSDWWRRWEGPALLVFLITAIFMAGASWLKLDTTDAKASTAAELANAQGNRITALEATQQSIKDSLAEIKQSLRDINNELKTRH
jgi:hypothetical protein